MQPAAIALGSMLVAASVLAQAADVRGWIKRLDAKANAITLNDGNTYLLPATITTNTMTLGQHVRVTYSLQGRRRMVTRIERSN